MRSRISRLRIYVERQLDGDFDQRNFLEILGGLRQYTNNIDSMREVCDFYSHQEGRDKGLVTARSQNSFDLFILKYKQLRDGSLGPKFPLMLKRVARYVLKTLNGGQVYEMLKLRRSDAIPILESALSKFHEIDGAFVAVELLTQREHQVFLFCLSFITMRPTFTNKGLIKDYARLLKINDLLAAENINKINLLEPDLTMHVMVLMHESTIIIDDNYRAGLSAGIDHNGMLCVNALASIEPDKPDGLEGEITILETNLAAKDWICSDFYEDLELSAPKKSKFTRGVAFVPGYYDKNGTWPATYKFECPIEVRDRKLTELKLWPRTS